MAGYDRNLTLPIDDAWVYVGETVTVAFSYPEDRAVNYAAAVTPVLVIGDTFKARATLMAGIPNEAYAVEGGSLSAAVISAAHTERYCDAVEQSSELNGSDWASGVVVVSIPMANTAQIATFVSKQEIAKVEIQATLNGENYTWFAPVRVVPGNI